MNYERIYNAIVSNAKHRTLKCYSEKHHIVPRSLGGPDTDDNLVALTAREHFICHWLLSKFTQGEDRSKMIFALQLMKGNGPHQDRYDTPITARVYENIRTQVGRIASERNTGRVQPRHEKEKQVQAQTGRKRAPFSNEWKQNLSRNHKSKQEGFNGSLSEETRKKIGDAIRGNKRDPEVSALVADKIRGLKRDKKLCPHCNKEIAVNGYARWHGDNCKEKV